MTSIERTVYPRFTRAPSVKELREIYTPTPTDLAFVAITARGPAQKFALVILLSVSAAGYLPKRKLSRSNHQPYSSRHAIPVRPGARYCIQSHALPLLRDHPGAPGDPE